MPEPQVFTTYRGWPIVRKASSPAETRDWFAEQETFANVIDADVQTIAPNDRIFSFIATADPAENWARLKNADAAAKASSPSLAKPAIVKIPACQIFTDTEHLAMDTDFMIYVCEKQAKRTQWNNAPEYSEVEPAGAQLAGTYTGVGIVHVTALNVVAIGFDLQILGVSTDPPLVVDTPYSETAGPILVGFSVSDNGLEWRTPSMGFLKNCHFEAGLCDDYSNMGGLALRCSNSGGKVFREGGRFLPLEVRDSLLKYENNGDGSANLDEVDFVNCRIFGTFAWFQNNIDSGACTTKTRFLNCYIDTTGLGGVQTADLRSNPFQIRNSTTRVDYAISLGAGGSMVGCDCQNPAGGATAIHVGILHGPIIGNRIRGTGLGSVGIENIVDMAGQPDGEITGNVIEAETGIAAGVPYAGGNVTNRVWFDTGASTVPAHATTHQEHGSDPLNIRERDGTCTEQQDTEILVDGGSIYCDVELVGGGDVPIQIGGVVYDLDCTTGAAPDGRARVMLTPGTDTEPEFNFIIAKESGGSVTLQSSTSAPTGEWAYVAFAALWSVAKTITDGPASHRRATDAIHHSSGGRIHHIDAKLRQLGASWANGVDPTASIDTVPSPDTVDLTVTGGIVWQLHPQQFPALQVSVDGCYVANASGAGVLTNYQKVTTLGDLLEDVAGNSLSGQRFNLVIWGTVSKLPSECKLFANLSAEGYATDEGAYFDTAGVSITSVPRELFDVAFLIARVPLRHIASGGGQFNFINPAGYPEIIDLRGLALGASGGGAGGGGGASTLAALDDVNITTPTLGEVLEYNGGNWHNAAPSGEANTGSNVGTGLGVFKQKAGVDLEFKTLKTVVPLASISDSDSITVSQSPSGVGAGSYTNTDLTVDAYGRITAASNGSGGGGGVSNPHAETFPVSDVQQAGGTTAGQVYWTPFIPRFDMTIDDLQCWMTYSGTTEVLRMGIYNAAGTKLDETAGNNPTAEGIFTAALNTGSIALTGGLLYFLAIKLEVKGDNVGYRPSLNDADNCQSQYQGAGALPANMSGAFAFDRAYWMGAK